MLYDVDFEVKLVCCWCLVSLVITECKNPCDLKKCLSCGQFYTWFKFYFPLCQTQLILIYYFLNSNQT